MKRVLFRSQGRVNREVFRIETSYRNKFNGHIIAVISVRSTSSSSCELRVSCHLILLDSDDTFRFEFWDVTSEEKSKKMQPLKS